MREILFRGKMMDADGWVYGTFLKDGEPFKINLNHPFSNCYIVPETDLDNIKSKSSGGAYFLQTTAFHVFPETVGQFTGLSDMNGKKIFEGDIIVFNRKRNLPYYKVIPEVVFYDERNAQFTRGASPYATLQKDMMSECEVIGNIHDNPELLKGE